MGRCSQAGGPVVSHFCRNWAQRRGASDQGHAVARDRLPRTPGEGASGEAQGCSTCEGLGSANPRPQGRQDRGERTLSDARARMRRECGRACDRSRQGSRPDRSRGPRFCNRLKQGIAAETSVQDGGGWRSRSLSPVCLSSGGNKCLPGKLRALELPSGEGGQSEKF